MISLDYIGKAYQQELLHMRGRYALPETNYLKIALQICTVKTHPEWVPKETAFLSIITTMNGWGNF